MLEDPVNQYRILLAVASFLLGYVLRWSRLCWTRALRRTFTISTEKTYMDLFLIVLTMGASFVLMLALLQWHSVDLSETPYGRAELALGGLILGGFMFGAGMVLVRSCISRQLILIGTGSGRSLLGMVIIMFCLWLISHYNPLVILQPFLHATTISLDTPQQLSQMVAEFGIPSWLVHAVYLLGLSFVIVKLWRLGRLEQSSKDIVKVVVKALMIAGLLTFVWWLTSSELAETARENSEWSDTPHKDLGIQGVSYLQSLLSTLFWGVDDHFQSTSFGVGSIIIVMGLLGTFFFSFVHRDFSLSFNLSLRELPRFLIGNVLLTVGGVIALGCSFGQAITGFSTGSLGSLIMLFSMLGGYVIMLRWTERGNLENKQMPIQPSGKTQP